MQVPAAYAQSQNKPILIDTFDLDGPRAGEVLIEMKAAGLCHSDMSFFNGSRDWSDYPIVLGHEGAGIVRACGAGVTSVVPGDHVIPIGIPECGVCPACCSGKTNLCDVYFTPTTRRPFSLAGRPVRAFCELGTFAPFIVAREIQVTKIRPDAPLDVVCCLGCAGATGIGAAIYTARMEPGVSAVVFGLGGIGLNVVEGARLSGARMIIGVDVNSGKEPAARSAGATHFLNPGTAGNDLVGIIKELTGGGADYSFECVGQAALLRQAVECTRIGWGTTVMLGVLPGTQEITLRPRSIQEGRRLMGSYLGNIKTRSELPRLVDWYMEKKISLDGLISHRIRLNDIAHGFDLLAKGEARRVVVEFG
jgi:S-(hydroxymethyl)glutathione dehydrogenase / alcohol dehydrogenase